MEQPSRWTFDCVLGLVILLFGALCSLPLIAAVLFWGAGVAGRAFWWMVQGWGG